MARVLELDELVEHFTLLPDEVALLRNKFGATRLGFALLLKFFVRAGRFPSGRSELGDEVLEFVAGQGAPASDLGFYDWSGRTIKAHRAEVRRVLGFRERSVDDAEKLTDWLTEQVAPAERRPELVREALIGRCRDERVEPPAPARVGRIVAAALYRAEEGLFDRVAGRLSAVETARGRGLAAVAVLDDTDPGLDTAAELGTQPGSHESNSGDTAGPVGAELLGLIRSEPDLPRRVDHHAALATTRTRSSVTSTSSPARSPDNRVSFDGHDGPAQTGGGANPRAQDGRVPLGHPTGAV
ncbi:DUF4158 domain-containing protein [Pseudonocardia sp. KRD291]|uniref:DUF4158 domain-containing protein n=1 Tax=Pseudonocardia sp. KRD291 TaxID=2792007 RepID=UPI0027E22124|nr:DUF4158 domain-containing protein [Pseudonocardia sp. KRD291]